MPTGLEGGIGIPHARSAHVDGADPRLRPQRRGRRLRGAPDGPAHLIFLIAAPDGGGADHMTILAKLARKLVHAVFKDALRGRASAAGRRRPHPNGGAGT